MRPAHDDRRPERAFAATLFLLLACLGLLLAPPAAGEELNRIILRVNDQIATLYEYEQRKSAEISRLMQDTSLSPADRQDRLAEIGKMVLFAMYREMLLESHAERSGVDISDRDVDAAVENMMEQRGIENRDQLQSALAASGMTLDDLRQSVREELLYSQVVRRDVMANIEVGEDELRAYYRNNPERFRVPEERRIEEIIVLEESGLPPEELAAKADEIRQILARELPPVEPSLSGEPSDATTEAGDGESATPDAAEEEDAFDRLVAPWHEEGLTTRVIELGWLERKDLGESLSEAAWAVDEGALTQPVQARGGFHVLRVLEVRGGEILPYNQVEDRILAMERQRRFGKSLNEFMGELASTSYVVEDIPPEAIGYRALADFSVPEELSVFRAPLEEGEEGPGEGDVGEGDVENEVPAADDETEAGGEG